MEQKNNIVIAFTKEAEFALLDIEKKYKLEENDEEAIKKIREDKLFRINIIANLVREFVKNNIQEKNFIYSLQKDLNINNETAKKILKDIITSIIPFLIKTSEEEIENGVFKSINDNKQTQPITIKPTRLTKPINSVYSPDEIQNEIQKNIEPLPPPPSPAKISTNINKQTLDRKKIKKNIIEKPIKENTKKQTDIYRESIE